MKYLRDAKLIVPNDNLVIISDVRAGQELVDCVQLRKFVDSPNEQIIAAEDGGMTPVARLFAREDPSPSRGYRLRLQGDWPCSPNAQNRRGKHAVRTSIAKIGPGQAGPEHGGWFEIARVAVAPSQQSAGRFVPVTRPSQSR